MSRQPDGAGKGDLSRPLGVPMETFDNNWDAIFNKEEKKKESSVHVDIEIANDEKNITVTKTWNI
jgi:hypothetical protein